MQLVKTLSAIAIFGGAIPSTFALSVKDDQLSVNFKFHVQERATFSNAKADPATLPGTATADDWDINRGGAGKPEIARFDLRRARFGFAVKYGDAWTGTVMVRGEQNDRAGANVGGRPIQLYYANAARIFKVDDDTQHDIHVGLDKPFNSESSISSTAFMTPNERVVSIIEETRGVGIGYGFRSPMVDFGVDVQNNLAAAKDPQAGNDQGEEKRNGMLYSGRIQFMPGKEWKPKARQESYAGKEGTHLVVGFDAMIDAHNLNDDGAIGTFTDTTTTTFGPDVLFHWNYLTFLAEYRWRNAKIKQTTDATGVDTAATGTVKGKYYDIGVGYAFPVSDMFLEPSLRYGRRDMNKDFASDAPYTGGAASGAPAANVNSSLSSGSDIGADGKSITVGLSLYINGHNNKIQLSYENWKAETGESKANIVRLQHQWAF